ncbi:hypothetical protein GGR57DRAFT_228594 [Xylariaceae sp. FL1272]|nr:hypothetical protein GGR57DRAFT_228594 [Xylariaceae sp. FL1272]
MIKSGCGCLLFVSAAPFSYVTTTPHQSGPVPAPAIAFNPSPPSQHQLRSCAHSLPFPHPTHSAHCIVPHYTWQRTCEKT